MLTVSDAEHHFSNLVQGVFFFTRQIGCTVWWYQVEKFNKRKFFFFFHAVSNDVTIASEAGVHNRAEYLHVQFRVCLTQRQEFNKARNASYFEHFEGCSLSGTKNEIAFRTLNNHSCKRIYTKCQPFVIFSQPTRHSLALLFQLYFHQVCTGEKFFMTVGSLKK